VGTADDRVLVAGGGSSWLGGPGVPVSDAAVYVQDQ